MGIRNLPQLIRTTGRQPSTPGKLVEFNRRPRGLLDPLGSNSRRIATQTFGER